MEDQVPKEVVQERFERLVALQDKIAAEESAKQIGTTGYWLPTMHPRGKETGRQLAEHRIIDCALVFLLAAKHRAPETLLLFPHESHPYHLIADPIA